ncbi:hypothetical protein ACFQZJ_12855 [Maribacter chungangensis]|uniref:Uncharacterized protein n=1 Tax=Maribacter chungangensis TaxID=1069117 RepID=A0ABW3B5T4_9FLAO
MLSQLRIDTETWKWWLNERMNNSNASGFFRITTPTFIICPKDFPVISITSIYVEDMSFL